MAMREVRDRADMWGQTCLDEYEMLIEFRDRDDTLSEFRD
jgi:hypothetical protein